VTGTLVFDRLDMSGTCVFGVEKCSSGTNHLITGTPKWRFYLQWQLTIVYYLQ